MTRSVLNADYSESVIRRDLQAQGRAEQFYVPQRVDVLDIPAINTRSADHGEPD